MQLFDNHHWTMKYVKLLGLEIDPIQPSTLAQCSICGRRLELKAGQHVEWPLSLNAEEAKLDRRGLWAKYVLPVLPELGDDTIANWPPASLSKYDQMSFAEFLRMRGASPDAVALLSLFLPSGLGDGATTVSALNLLRESIHREHMKHSYTIRGGTDALPRALAARLAPKINYGAPVVRIEQTRTVSKSSSVARARPGLHV